MLLNPFIANYNILQGIRIFSSLLVLWKICGNEKLGGTLQSTSLSVCDCMCGWLEWARLLVCFCYPWLSFFELQAKSEPKLSLTPPFGECVPSGTTLRMYFIKLHWFVLSAPKGYLFTNPFICYIPFQPYAGSKYWSADENTKLTNCLRSALTLWGILYRKEMESKLKKWLGIIFEKHAVVRDAVVETRLPGIPPWFFMSLSFLGSRAWPFSSIILVPFGSP